MDEGGLTEEEKKAARLEKARALREKMAALSASSEQQQEEKDKEEWLKNLDQAATAGGDAAGGDKATNGGKEKAASGDKDKVSNGKDKAATGGGDRGKGDGGKKRDRDRDDRKRDDKKEREEKKERRRSRSRSRSPRSGKRRSRSRDRKDKDRRRSRSRDRDRRKSRSRSRDRKDKDRRRSRSRDRDKRDEKKAKMDGDKKSTPAQIAEADEVEEQMRLRRERVAKWRAEKTSTGGAEVASPAAKAGAGAGGDVMEEEEKEEKVAKALDAAKAEENYFDKESDDEDKENDDKDKDKARDKDKDPDPDPQPAKAADAMEEDDDVDPLDAYMKGVTKEVTQLEEEDKKLSTKVADLDSIMNLSKSDDKKGTGKSKSMQGLGMRIEVDDSIPDLDEEERKKEEEFDIKQWLEQKNQCKNLRPVDHKAVSYMPFRKNFYIEVPEIAKMTDEQVKSYRSSLDGIKVRGKRCPNPINSWFQCGLSDRTLAVIKKMGWKKPSAIQCQALPVIMSGRDCIGVAKTGSGKTASYLLPCFRHCADQPPMEQGDGPIALVFTPARELCVQVFQQAKHFFKHAGVSGCAVYGGAPVADQIAELKKGPQIVICTPGRMIDMLCANAGKVTNLKRVTYLTIDEADRMFDLGFEPQITKVLENTRPDRQTVFFSATFPKQMEALARKHLRHPIEMVVGGRSVVSNTIEHFVELREPHERFFRLLELLGEWVEQGQILIFVERQDSCDELLTMLIKQGHSCLTLHGGMDQADRDSTLADFKNKVCNNMIATSLAARGLDVPGLNLVVNYDAPSHYEDYVHRVGRTGRAGNKGTAYTFVSPSQRDVIPDMVRALTSSGKPVPKDLRAIANNIKEEKKKGNKVAKGSGFGGKGFKFDEEEQKKLKDAAARNRKMLLIANGEEEASEEEEDTKADDEDFDEQANNLNTQHAQKVADWTAKNVEAESNKAFNDLVKKATGGLLLQHIVPKKADGSNLYGMIAGVPAPSTPAPGAPGLAGGMVASAGALVTSDVAARAKAAAAALGLAPRAPVMPTMVGGGALALTTNPSALAAMEAAKKAAAGLGLAGANTGVPAEPDHFQEELEINDYPQHARWKATHRDSIAPIVEFCDVSVTNKGIYVKPGLQPPAGERKLYLLIEGDAERKVKMAASQFKKLLQEATMESTENTRPLFAKYTV